MTQNLWNKEQERMTYGEFVADIERASVEYAY